MKKQTFLFLLSILPLMASAFDATIDGIYYNLNSSTYQATVKSIDSQHTGSINIPETVWYEGVSYSVTAIGDYAFYNCSSLAEVIIGSGVTSIGKNAFYKCTGTLIVNCNIPSASSSSDGAFYGSKFSSVTIGDGVESIGDYAFYYCSGLTSVTIPNSVKSIGKSAFYNCSSLTEVIIGSGVTSIGKYAFNNCTGNLTVNCNIPLASSYSEGAFYCSKFSSVKIGDGVEVLGDYAFYYCSDLTGIIIPNRVTSIGKSVFYHCTDLTSIIVENGNKKYDSRDNCNAIIETATNSLLLGCKNTVIPNSVMSIGDNAFYSCTGMTSIEIPSSVTSIGNFAFSRCSGLTDVTFPNSVTSLGKYAFSSCSSIKSVDIPNSIKRLNDNIFSNCTNLESIKIPASLERFNTYAFEKCPNISSISVDEDNPIFDSRNNCNAIINSSTNKLLFGCKTTVIPPTVKSIAANAFKGSTITDITIPNNIEGIGNSAFADCDELKFVTVRFANPIKIESNVFSDSAYNKAVLYVPTGRKTYFEDATVWERFVNIQEMDMPDVVISDSPYENVGRNQMILGYYTSDDISEKNYGGRNAGLYKVCIGFSREQMIPFAGNRITNVRFALKDTDISDLKLWIGSTRDKNDLCSQSVVSPQIGWNEVALNSPYEITGDSIFIGIEYKQSGTRWPVSVVPEGAELGSCYFYGPYDGADKDEIWLEPGENESLSLQCIVEGEKIPMYDIRLTNITVDKYFKQGKSVSGNIYCRNWGKKEPQQVDVEIKMNGIPVYTIQNREFSSSYYYNFTPQDLPVGIYNMEVAVTALNGDRPQHTVNDTLRASITIWDTDMGRQKVYFEQYTATWCPHTIGTLYDTKDIAAARDDVTFVLIHSNDELSCNTGNEYKVFYDGNINNAKARPSFANVNIAAGYDDVSRQLYIKVSGEKHEYFDMFEKNANLTVLLTEDSVVCPQYDGQNNRTIIWKHQAVLRNNVSEIWGDPIEWNGKIYEKKYSVTLDNRWDKDNMKIVAFLAKPFTGKNFDEIYAINCNDFSVKDAIYATSIDDLDGSVLGDVNGDGVVNGTDIQTVINHIVAGQYDEKADVNEDGQVNGTDIQEIINIIVNSK